MASLHTFDLMNAFTQEIIQNLRIKNLTNEADVVKRNVGTSLFAKLANLRKVQTRLRY